jgi:hypothetical protein
VVAWREQKRREGYQPLTVWLKADVKHKIEDLAAQRREDLGQVITEAIIAYDGAGPAAPVEAPALYRLIDERLAALLPSLLHQAPAVSEQTGPAAPLELAPVLLRGEYGELTHAVRRAAQELRRFTHGGIVTHIGRDRRSIASSLKRLVQKGALRKKGTVYYWVDDAATTDADAPADQP